MRVSWACSVFSEKRFRSVLDQFGECFYLPGLAALGLVPGPDKQPFLWRLYYLERLSFASSALSTLKSCSGFGSDSRGLWRPRESRTMAITERREGYPARWDGKIASHRHPTLAVVPFITLLPRSLVVPGVARRTVFLMPNHIWALILKRTALNFTANFNI